MKFSHTLFFLGAVAFASNTTSGSVFSKLAERAVDSSSWNFDAAKEICSVYGDPHILTFAGTKLNYKGIGEYVLAGM